MTGWAKQYADIPLDRGEATTPHEYSVDPMAKALRSRDTVFDIPGVARRRPSFTRSASAFSQGSEVGGMSRGNTPLALFARGSEMCVVGHQGLTRYQGGSWETAGGNTYAPAGCAIYSLRSQNHVASGSVGLAYQQYIEHAGYRVMVYAPETSAGVLGNGGIHMMAWGSDGVALTSSAVEIAAAAAVSSGGNPKLVGGTWGGSPTVYVVWRDNFGTQLKMKVLTLSASGVSVGSEISLDFTVSSTANTFAAIGDPSSSSSGDWFVAVRPSTSANVVIHRMTSAGVTSYTHDTGTAYGSGDAIDICYEDAATDRVHVVAGYGATPDVDLISVNAADLTSATKTAAIEGSYTAHTAYRGVAVLGTSIAVMASSDTSFWIKLVSSAHAAEADTGEITGARILAGPVSLDGQAVMVGEPAGDSVAGHALATQLLTLQTDGTDLFPVPCGRFGNDAATYESFAGSNAQIVVDAANPSRAAFAYAQVLSGWPTAVRGITVDADAAHQRRYVDDGGVAYIAGSHLCAYDGDKLREADWATPPVIEDVTSGGSGDQIGVTTECSFRAVFVWIDTQGRAHRSKASAAVTYTPSLATERMRVDIAYPKLAGALSNRYALPPTLDPTAFFTEIYIKQSGDSTHKLAYGASIGQNELQPTSMTTSSSPDYDIGRFDYASYDSSGAILYEEFGSELPANPSPPCLDLEIIGDRMWLLDAEDPERLWPSKTRAEGYAWEFNAALVQRVPGGPGVALSQINGQPLFMRRNGLFILYGDGPANSGSGGIWSTPRRIDSAPGCIEAATVVRVPAGVIYRGPRGFYLLDPSLAAQPIGLDVEREVTGTYVSATYDPARERVVFWPQSSSDVARCLDLRSMKWSSWNLENDMTGAVQLDNGDVWAMDDDGSNHDGLVLSEGTFSGDTGHEIETGWIQPQGGEGRVRFTELQVRGEYIGAHVLKVTTYFDFDGNGTDITEEPQTWTNANLTDAQTGDLFTLNQRLVRNEARAVRFKFTVNDSGSGLTTEGCRLISARVHWKTDGKTQRAAGRK